MKKILITSALPYVNNVPHLGNIIGSVLSADVFARFCRSRGWTTRYICGADEHGTTTEAKALEEGLTPQQICDKYCKLHKDIYDWFGISFDEFGRTSTDTHKKITQEIFLKLHENGYIKEDFLEELYCEKCKKSLADRFVEGICPFCGFENARGDQCDKCGHLLNAVELKNPKCKICGSVPTKKSTKHLFLDLEKLQPELEKWIKQRSKEGFWTENTITYTNAWLKEGLKKRCISRQLKWGIPIPLKGFEDMVFYVWFDAPIGYISITAHKFNDWKDWWKNPEHVDLYQFMGKDNVPFHTIIFPGTLIGTRDKYTLLYHINTTEYLNYEDGKFSKSRNIGVFGDDAMQLGLPADSFRYYLLVNRPEKADTTFSWDDFQDKLNHELIGTLGNLVNRTIVFLNKYYNSKVPEPDLGKNEEEFLYLIRDQENKITDLLSKVKLKEALKEILALCANGNKFFQAAEPWKNVKEKENKKIANNALYILTNLVKDIGILCEPYMPFTSEKIFKQLNVEQKKWDNLGVLSIDKGHKVGKAEVLFNKLVDDEKKKLKEMFSGGGKKEAEEELTFEVSPEVERLGTNLVYAILEKVNVRSKALELEKMKSEYVNKFLKEDLTKDKIVRAYEELYKKVGADVEQPMKVFQKILMKSKRMPMINTVVDSYNFVSLKTKVSMGAHDVDKIKGKVCLKIADGTENYIPLGEDKPELIKKGEFIVADDEHVLCRLEVKQGEHTKIEKNTKRIMLYAQGNKETSEDYVEKALKQACELITKFSGGTYKIFRSEKDSLLARSAHEGKKGFDLLNLKVAKIKEVKDHPKADKLIILKLDLGREERQIVAGIKEWYKNEELEGKKIIVVTNLEPAEIRGEKSYGMLLAVEKAGKLGLVSVKKAEPGTQVLIEGAQPNKDIITLEEFKTVNLRAKEGKAYSDDKVLKAGDEELVVEKGVEGKIR